jgi:hypothetical protein
VETLAPEVGQRDALGAERFGEVARDLARFETDIVVQDAGLRRAEGRKEGEDEGERTIGGFQTEVIAQLFQLRPRRLVEDGSGVVSSPGSGQLSGEAPFSFARR